MLNYFLYDVGILYFRYLYGNIVTVDGVNLSIYLMEQRGRTDLIVITTFYMLFQVKTRVILL